LGAALGKLLFLGLALRGYLLLHLLLDHGSYFFLGCLLLAGAKYGRDDYHEQGEKILHVRIKFGLALLFERRAISKHAAEFESMCPRWRVCLRQT